MGPTVKRAWLAGGLGVLLLLGGAGVAGAEEKFKYQYEFGSIQIPRLDADEPKLPEVSVQRALDFLDQGATAWSRGHKCVTCHTNGSYMALRPSLTKPLGQPSGELRDFFGKVLREGTARLGQERKLGDSQMIYLARGLAEWDAHVSGTLSDDTRQALKQLFERQLPTGEWKAALCWPPLESSAFQEATVAALAVGTAPGWLAGLTDEGLKAGVKRLQDYLRRVEPPHDYGRVVLLWASAKLDGLLEEGEKERIIEMIWSKQRADGGWALRAFAEPEQWGEGNRAEKLRAEKEFADPPSDGHQTGLALIALREAGVSARDPRVQKGVRWLLANQRESGRWWTRSLNTDNYHFIAFSGTLYPLVALHLCDALPEEPAGNATAQARR